LQHFHLFHREDADTELAQEGILRARIAEPPKNAYISKRQYRHLRSQVLAALLQPFNLNADPLGLLQRLNPERERELAEMGALVMAEEKHQSTTPATAGRE
jgi:hypothetical protein